MRATFAVATLGVVPAGLAQTGGTGSPEVVAAEPLPVAVEVGTTFCAAVEAVQSEVTRRSPRIRFVPPGGAELRQVRVGGPSGPNGGSYFGTVSLRTTAGAEFQRELEAKTCEDLVRAVGFVISVTYDPPAPEALPPGDGPAEVPATSAADTPEPAPAPTAVGSTKGKAPDPTDVLEVPGPGEAPGSVPQWRVGLAGSALWGVAPSVMLGGAGFVALGWGPERGAGGLVRILFAGDVGGAEAFPGGVAAFQRWSGQLALGPEWHLGAVHLGLAATGRAGVVRAEGRATVEPQRYDRLWLDGGGSVLARVEVLAPWHLETELALTKPLTRYAFQFDPVVFHRVSSWLVHAGIAASVAF